MKMGRFNLAAKALIGFSLVSIASGSSITCLTPDPSPEYISRNAVSMDEVSQSQNAQNLTVDVYFHIASSVANANAVTDQRVADQFEVLQKAFLPSGISFSLRNTSRVTDDFTSTGFYKEDGSMGDENFAHWLAYMQRTRQGPYSSLNVYFYTDLPTGISGICLLPTTVMPGDEFFYRDGCQVHARTMPGGGDPAFLGHTAVHEVGHWFGLLHTFQGRCSDLGDGISDTPAQASGSSGCPEGRDSCPGLEGLDPIHNYMDYSSDSW